MKRKGMGAALVALTLTLGGMTNAPSANAGCHPQCIQGGIEELQRGVEVVTDAVRCVIREALGHDC